MTGLKLWLLGQPHVELAVFYNITTHLSYIITYYIPKNVPGQIS